MARPSFTQFVRDARQRGKLIVMDGPMGTELQQSGLDIEKELSHTWNLTHPNSVMVVHEDYANAGADCLLTNSFSAHVGILKGDPHWRFAVDKAIELARQPEWDHLYCLGSIGSAVGAEDVVLPAIQQVLAALTSCDAILLETQTRLDRVTQLLGQLAHSPDLPPLIISFSFSRLPKESNSWIVETIQGELRSAEYVGRWAQQHQHQLLAVGVNCGQNLRLTDFLSIIKAYRAHSDLPLLVKPGITSTIECEFTPNEFAEKVKDFADAGVTLIGGCCGVRPAHIAALRREIDRLGLGCNEF